MDEGTIAGDPRNRDDAPTFDAREVLAHLDGDRSLLREILAIFRQDSPKQLEAMARAIESGDGRELARAAHALKGAVSNFAAAGAVALAARLESMGESGNLSAAGSTQSQLVAELARLDDDLSSFLEASD